MRTECAVPAIRESLLRASHSSSAPLLRPTARIFDCGSYATAVAWSSSRLLRSTKAWVNSGSTRYCDPTAHHHDSAASAHSAATTSAQSPQVRMCIHPLAMADGLSAVPDYLPGRHRGERPRSWSSSPLLIVIPALDRHPRESGDLASLIPTASRPIGRAHVELQSLMRLSYAVFCLKNKKT